MRKRGRPRINPQGPEEWQEAVNGAQLGLEIDSCFQYGLLEGIAEDGTVLTESGVNVARCERILAAGKKMGIVPQSNQTP
jgi:hypothetical protein